MTGSIDLAFEHRGKWYVVDYKSNTLGQRAGDYGKDGMDAAIVTITTCCSTTSMLSRCIVIYSYGLVMPIPLRRTLEGSVSLSAWDVARLRSRNRRVPRFPLEERSLRD